MNNKNISLNNKKFNSVCIVTFLNLTKFTRAIDIYYFSYFQQMNLFQPVKHYNNVLLRKPGLLSE